MADPQMEELFNRWQAAWSGKDPGAFAEACAPDIHYEDPVAAEPLDGIDALTAHAGRLWTGFPDARLETLGQRLVDGRFAAAPAKLLATHREPLEGLPASNRFIVVPVIFYCELDSPGELLWRVRAFFDVYDAAVQLGVLPARGTLSEKAMLMVRGFGLRPGR